MKKYAGDFLNTLQQLINHWNNGEIEQASKKYDKLIEISTATCTDFNKNMQLALVKLKKQAYGVLDSNKIYNYEHGVLPSVTCNKEE